MLEAVSEFLWPSGVLAKLGRALGALSALALINHVFSDGSGPVYRLLLDYYDKLVSALIGWAKPWVESGLAHVGWRAALYPHWKHIVVFMGIYFWRNAFISYRAGDRFVGGFEMGWGLTIAMAASIAAGGVPLVSADVAANFLIAAAPITGVFVYESGDIAWRAIFYRERAARIYHRPIPTWWGYFAGGVRGSFKRTCMGIILLWGGLHLPVIQRLAAPGLAMLAILVVIQALNFLWMGVPDVDRLRAPGESWGAAYWRSGVAKLGAAMLSVFFWLGVLLLTNAGLSLYGL